MSLAYERLLPLDMYKMPEDALFGVQARKLECEEPDGLAHLILLELVII